MALVEAKAAHDFHYDIAYNACTEGSEEFGLYESKLAEL